MNLIFQEWKQKHIDCKEKVCEELKDDNECIWKLKRQEWKNKCGDWKKKT